MINHFSFSSLTPKPDPNVPDARPTTQDARRKTLSPGLRTPDSRLFSILVPNYNYAHYISEALDSLITQTYDHWEAIVVDDGSTDDSRRVIEAYEKRDNRIRSVMQNNAGVGVALNTAFENCRGAWICLLDADDYFEPNKLERIVEKITTMPNAGFIQHAMHVVDAEGNRLRRLPGEGVFEEGWIQERVIRRGGRWRSMPASALTIRRDVAEYLFPVPAQLRSMVDAYFYMLAPLVTEVGFIDHPLAAYRLHSSNLTGSAKLGPDVSRKYLEGFGRVFESINEKREKENLPSLDMSRHLTCNEHRYMQRLFEGVPRDRLLKDGRQLRRQIQADDVYSPARKLLGRITFFLAPLLPRGLRAGWINGILGRKQG